MPDAAKTDTLLPAYLIDGEDKLKRTTVLKRLRARMETLGDLAFNSDVFSGEGATGEAVVAACNTLPFASGMRLVVVEAADRLKKDDAEALVSYLAAPSPSTVLALVAEKLAKNTRLFKAVAAQGKAAVIDCAPPRRHDLKRAVRSLAVGHGITLTESGADVLIDLIGGNTLRLDSELQKVALAHSGPDPVGGREVGELVSRVAEVKPWEFVDAFSARDITASVLILGRMPHTSPHALLALCTARLRELICAQSLAARGTSGGLAAALKMPDWRVKNHLSWSNRYSPAELRGALIAACETERVMKSGADPSDAFLDWALAVMRRHGPGGSGVH